jgi:tRNA (mo5U34)-methyltransferase
MKPNFPLQNEPTTTNDPESVEVDAIEARVRELRPWFHNLHLPGGVRTVLDHFLGDFPAYKWEETAKHLPEDMASIRALDIGCNAGFYAMELARRGASVTAVDMNPHYLEQARWAAGLFGLDRKIDFRRMQVYELARTGEKWDLVLFLGTFYHLRHPLLALDIVRRVTASTLIFQTMTIPEPDSVSTRPSSPLPFDLPFDERSRMGNSDWPRMAFIENWLAGDPTNWWAADASCAEAMLRSSGFEDPVLIGVETWMTRPDPNWRPEHWLLEEYAAVVGL